MPSVGTATKTARFPRFLLPRRITIHGFICGCGHSGTTLIANILAAHPNAYVPLEETGIFLQDDFKVARRHLQLLWRAALSGKRAFIEKTPRHIYKLDLIRARVPGARFVIPVRDGRDTVASLFKRRGDLDAAMRRWVGENEIVLAQRGKPDVLIYRHEDLVGDAPATVRRICQFLDLDYSDQLLDYHKAKRLWFGETELRAGAAPRSEHAVLRNWQVNQPIFDNRGRWRTELSEDDILELTQGRGRPLMQAFGYL